MNNSIVSAFGSDVFPFKFGSLEFGSEKFDSQPSPMIKRKRDSIFIFSLLSKKHFKVIVSRMNDFERPHLACPRAFSVNFATVKDEYTKVYSINFSSRLEYKRRYPKSHEHAYRIGC